MTVDRTWVQQVEQVLAEVAPKVRKTRLTPEAEALRAFQYHETFAPALVVDQTPRARAIREVMRIATWYGWMGEVARSLDRELAASLASLSDEGLDQLVVRMRLLEECAQNGGQAPDAPAAT